MVYLYPGYKNQLQILQIPIYSRDESERRWTLLVSIFEQLCTGHLKHKYFKIFEFQFLFLYEILPSSCFNSAKIAPFTNNVYSSGWYPLILYLSPINRLPRNQTKHKLFSALLLPMYGLYSVLILESIRRHNICPDISVNKIWRNLKWSLALDFGETWNLFCTLSYINSLPQILGDIWFPRISISIKFSFTSILTNGWLKMEATDQGF